MRLESPTALIGRRAIRCKEGQEFVAAMDASDFTIAIYLNQASVFDLLAIMEDGLAQVSTIKTSESSKAKVDAGLGATNVFALLGVRLGGGMESAEGREVTHERVHTPTSLFAKVRSRLKSNKLVRDLSQPAALDNVRPGQFVEFEATLRRNPLLDGLEAVGETISGIKVLQSFNPGQKNSGQKGQPDSLKQVGDMIKKLREAMGGSGSLDLVGDIVPGPGQVVVPVELRYFGDHSPEELADGHYRVFGKIVRTVTEQGQSISLLRNTTFAHMPGALEPLTEGFASAKAAGLTLPHFVTRIDAPVLQVVPVAIFL